jgi:ABC-type glycerol-3-phosphate transport system permease component
MSKLNSKTLSIAAFLLLGLALLFVATPLLRVPGAASRTGFNRQFTGQTAPGAPNNFPSPGDGTQGQGFTAPNSGSQNPGGSTTGRTFTNQPGSNLLRLSFLSGITGTIVYALALLVSLAAAVGMFITRRWGQILGVIMAVVYLLLSLLNLIPMFLLGFASGLNALSLGLGITHLILAVAVIVLAVIPAKRTMTPPMPITPESPPAASA